MSNDPLRIQRPCRLRWDSLLASDSHAAGTRSCESCQTQVIDGSRLTRAEALEALQGADGGLCMRMIYGREGSSIHPEPSPVAAASPRLRRGAHWFVAAATALLAACTDREAKPSVPQTGESPAPAAPSDESREALEAQQAAGAIELLGYVGGPDD